METVSTATIAIRGIAVITRLTVTLMPIAAYRTSGSRTLVETLSAATGRKYAWSSYFFTCLSWVKVSVSARG
jgi:hypothetical protein